MRQPFIGYSGGFMDNRTAKIIAIIMCLITAACLAAAVVLSSEGFTKGAADKLSVIASEAAGTKVELGTVSISSINSVGRASAEWPEETPGRMCRASG